MEATTTTATLYDRLGGAPAIEAALDLMYGKVLADPGLAPYFERVNVSRHAAKAAEFVGAALGGPEVYRGKDMRSAHARLAICAPEFAAVAVYLAESLAELGVADEVAAELLAVVGSLQSEVVTVSGALVS
jgi:hemoglobin